jgi:hypothetical protein
MRSSSLCRLMRSNFSGSGFVFDLLGITSSTSELFSFFWCSSFGICVTESSLSVISIAISACWAFFSFLPSLSVTILYLVSFGVSWRSIEVADLFLLAYFMLIDCYACFLSDGRRRTDRSIEITTIADWTLRVSLQVHCEYIWITYNPTGYFQMSARQLTHSKSSSRSRYFQIDPPLKSPSIKP